MSPRLFVALVLFCDELDRAHRLLRLAVDLSDCNSSEERRRAERGLPRLPLVGRMPRIVLDPPGYGGVVVPL